MVQSLPEPLAKSNHPLFFFLITSTDLDFCIADKSSAAELSWKLLDSQKNGCKHEPFQSIYIKNIYFTLLCKIPVITYGLKDIH